MEAELISDDPNWELLIGRTSTDSQEFPVLPAVSAMAPSSDQGQAAIVGENRIVLPPGRCTVLSLRYTARAIGETETNIRLNHQDCAGDPLTCSRDFLIRAQITESSRRPVWLGEIALSQPAEKILFTRQESELQLASGNTFRNYRFSADQPDFLYSQVGQNNGCSPGEYYIEHQIDNDGHRLQIEDPQGNRFARTPPCNVDARLADDQVRIQPGTCGETLPGVISGRVELFNDDDNVTDWRSNCDIPESSAIRSIEARVLCQHLGFVETESSVRSGCGQGTLSFELDCLDDTGDLDQCIEMFPPNPGCNSDDSGVICQRYSSFQTGCYDQESTVLSLCGSQLKSFSIQSLIDGSPQFNTVGNLQNLENLENTVAWYSPDSNRAIILDDRKIALYEVRSGAATLLRSYPVEPSDRHFFTGKAGENAAYLIPQRGRFIERFDFDRRELNQVDQTGHERLVDIQGITLSRDGILAVLHDNRNKVSFFFGETSGGIAPRVESTILFLLMAVSGLIVL